MIGSLFIMLITLFYNADVAFLVKQLAVRWRKALRSAKSILVGVVSCSTVAVVALCSLGRGCLFPASLGISLSSPLHALLARLGQNSPWDLEFCICMFQGDFDYYPWIE